MIADGFLFCACLYIHLVSSVSPMCADDFANDTDYPYKYFQTKTLYDTVRGEISISDRPAGCSPVAIVFVSRHGSRYPGSDEVDKFQALADLAKIVNNTGNATLCKEDLNKISNWVNWYQTNYNYDLATTGYAEQFGLGERYSMAFPELFTNSSKHRFLSSDTQRAIYSAKAFMDGFMSEFEERPEIEINNRLTRFYDYCDRYIKEVDENNTLLADVKEFENGEVLSQITKDFAARLGVPGKVVSNSLVEYARKQGCAEEEWATGNDSAWCLAFTKDDFQVFEYEEDMKDYLDASFGVEISYKSSCELKHVLLSALKNASVGNTSQPNLFVYGHSHTMMSLLSEMKLIQDDGPFTSADYPEALGRKFKATFYTPGSGNVAFVLHNCGDANDMKLQIFHNEKLLYMPLDEPPTDGLWRLEDALQYFGYYNDQDCLWDYLCSIEDEVINPTIETTTSFADRISPSVALFLVLLDSTWRCLH